MKKLVLSFITLFIGLTLTAQVTISAKEFAALQKSNKSLVVVDATKASTYARMHIMRSINIPYAELNKSGDIAGLIKDPETIAAYLGKKGISNDSEIVVYDEGSNKYSSRVYWVLKYVGAKNVKILHKDMSQWKSARLRLTKSPTPVKPATFTAEVNPAIYAAISEVKAGLNKSNVVIVDCRAANEFDGSIESSKGHIPGAVHMEYKDVLKANGAFKSKVELNALAEKFGLTADKTIIVYCATSVRAAVSYIAFKDILGLDNVKVFDGAYNEWVADASNKVD